MHLHRKDIPEPTAESVPPEYHHAITSQRRELTTLVACFREFLQHFSPKAIVVAIVLVLTARIIVGEWAMRDLAVPFVIVAMQPFVEWIIHKYLLHLKPFTIGGREFDIYTAAAHRRHHMAPSILDRVLLAGQEVIGSMVLIAITAWTVVFTITVVFGGSVLPLWLSAVLWSYLGLLRYEWSHFLIHTPYIPKSRMFRSIWRSHRLHHFKHEDYWLGVSSNFGDRLLHTYPDQRKIAKSPTAKTLGTKTQKNS